MRGVENELFIADERSGRACHVEPGVRTCRDGDGMASAASRQAAGATRFAAESRHFSGPAAAPPVCTPDAPLCYSSPPFRIVAARPLRGGFSRGFGGVPKGFSGIKHRHNERELATMRLTIERAALLRALGHVQSVVERRNTIPILSNVLLRSEDGQLSLSATDMDLEIVASVAAQGARKGAATAPAHTLYDIVRKLREGAQVELEPWANATSWCCAPAARLSRWPACRPRITR